MKVKLLNRDQRRYCSEDVLLDPDGLPHVLALTVPLLTFLAGWSEEIILGTQLLSI